MSVCINFHEFMLAARKEPNELNRDEAVCAAEVSTDEPERLLCESHEILADRAPPLTDASKPKSCGIINASNMLNNAGILRRCANTLYLFWVLA
jgi:hypothetical protein